MSMWWYAKEGERFGPIDESELRSKLVSAEVQPTDLVWQEGMDDWKPAMEVFPATPDEAPQSEAPSGAPGPEPSTAAAVPASAPEASTVSNEESKALSLGLKDYGDLLCWGIAIILIPCLGFFGYVALIVFFILEFIEVKKAVEEGKLPESQYSRVHPALLGLGLFCCSIIFYPLFMHWRQRVQVFQAPAACRLVCDR
jgi:hypothetical protein